MSLTLVLAGGGATGDWSGYVNRGLVLLVLACPCAIVIATPIPSICAIGEAGRSGARRTHLCCPNLCGCLYICMCVCQ